MSTDVAVAVETRELFSNPTISAFLAYPAKIILLAWYTATLPLEHAASTLNASASGFLRYLHASEPV